MTLLRGFSIYIVIVLVFIISGNVYAISFLENNSPLREKLNKWEIEAPSNVQKEIEILRVSSDAVEKYKAAERIENMGPRASGAIFVLIITLNDRTCLGWASPGTPIKDVQCTTSPSKKAGDALLKMGDKSIEPLLEALKDNDTSFRESVADVLGWTKDPRAITPLIASIHGMKYMQPRTVENALGRIGNKAVIPLLNALKDDDPKVRMVAAGALGKINDPRAVKPLIELLKDIDSSVRLSSVSALGSIKNPQAVEPLIEALKDSNANVRRYAAESLGGLQDARAVKPLIELLKDNRSQHYLDSDARVAAAVALGRIKDPQALEPLIEALKDIDNVRTWAMQSLIWMHDTRMVKPLIDALKDNDNRVRSGVAIVLEELVGMHFGEDFEKWNAWWEEHKGEPIKSTKNAAKKKKKLAETR